MHTSSLQVGTVIPYRVRWNVTWMAFASDEFSQRAVSIVQEALLPALALAWGELLIKILVESWMTEDVTLPVAVSDHKASQWVERLCQHPAIEVFKFRPIEVFRFRQSQQIIL
jgi:hypothetical protein